MGELLKLSLERAKIILKLDVTPYLQMPTVLLKIMSLQQATMASVLSLHARIDPEGLKGAKTDRMGELIDLVREMEKKVPAA